MLVKDINVKTLVSGDKSSRIVLETLHQEDIPKLAMLSDKIEVKVEFNLPRLPDDS